jgi:hypothetical protein
VPYSWISLSQVKMEHYKALGHYYVAVGLLEHEGDDFSTRADELLQFLHVEEEDEGQETGHGKKGTAAPRVEMGNLIEIRVPKDQDEKRYLGKLLVPAIITITREVYFMGNCLLLRLCCFGSRSK